MGANLGVVSLYAARLVGPEGQIHAFEPQPDLALKIEESATLNSFSNIHVHPIALSSEDGEACLTMPPGDRTSASLARTYKSERRLMITVRATGPYLSSLHLPQIRLIKLDVEGHEFDILCAAESFFQENMPEAILFESNKEKPRIPFKERRIVKWLKQRGFRCAGIPKAIWRMRLESAEDGSRYAHGQYVDYIAYRVGALETLLSPFIRR